MSQLYANKKGNNKNLHYRMPITLYEKFVNKRWIERKDIFETRSSFVAKANKIWKESSDSDRNNFISKPAPEIKKPDRLLFFKSAPTKAMSVSPTTSATSSLSCKSNEADAPYLPNSSTNADAALDNREKFLCERETDSLKSFFVANGIAYNKFFTDDVKGDDSLMQLFKKFIYKWNEFCNLRGKYEGNKQRHSKFSNLTLRIVPIDNSILKLKGHAVEMIEISRQIEELS